MLMMCQEEADMQLKAVPVISMQVVDNASACSLKLSSLLGEVMCFLSLVHVVHHKIPHSQWDWPKPKAWLKSLQLIADGDCKCNEW